MSKRSNRNIFVNGNYIEKQFMMIKYYSHKHSDRSEQEGQHKQEAPQPDESLISDLLIFFKGNRENAEEFVSHARAMKLLQKNIPILYKQYCDDGLIDKQYTSKEFCEVLRKYKIYKRLYATWQARLAKN